MTSDRSSGEPTLTAHQQAAVAHLGLLGLRIHDVDELLREGLIAVADTLGVGDGVLFEVRPEGEVLDARAGLRGGRMVGRHRLLDVHLPVDARSLPGYAVLQGHTVVAPDIDHDERFTTRAREHDFAAGAAIAAPIGWDEQPIGVVVLYDPLTRAWTDDEVHFVQAIATTMGLAMQRSRLESGLRESSTRLDTSLRAGGLGSWSWDPGRDHVELDPTALTVFGLDGERFGGDMASFLAVVHPDDREPWLEGVNASLGQGGGVHRTYRIVRPVDGQVRWIESWGRPLHTEARGWLRVGVCCDVTERVLAEHQREEALAREHAARVEAEAVRERLAFLVEAGTQLGASLDLEVTLQSVADLCVPYLADVCLIDLVEEDGRLTEAVGRARDAQSLHDVRELRRRRAELGGVGGVYSERSVAETEALIHTVITDDDYRRASVDDEHLELFRRFGARAAAIAPLTGRSGVLGVLSLLCNRPERTFEAEHLQLIEVLAARAALAIDNSQLFNSRNRVARSLQAALLPPALPVTRGITIAARYDVAESDAAIGGDFYDVIGLGGGAWGIVIGDVCGRGPEAAALTGLVRHSIRSAVVNDSRPSAVLANTNAAVLQQIDDAKFCTAAFLRAEVLDASAGRVHVAVASAGHPRPILVRADGQAEALDCSGTLLGVVAQPRLLEVDADLEAGDSIVLYTDGVTEARRGDEMFGERRLASVVGDLAAHSAEVIATGVEASVTAFRRSARDDTAILVVQAVASP